MDMTGWTHDLEKEWYEKKGDDYKKGECYLKAMGYTEDDWDDPIMGKMQADFDKSPLMGPLKGAEMHCRKKSDDGDDGGKFMR